MNEYRELTERMACGWNTWYVKNMLAQKGKKGGDSFHYWGGLLGTVALMEAGHYPAPEAPLKTMQ